MASIFNVIYNYIGLLQVILLVCELYVKEKIGLGKRDRE